MKRRTLGSSTLEVSQLSLGAMNFGMGFTRDTNVDEDLAQQLVDRALEAGVNLFDTAESYGQGRSEEVLGRAIRGRRDEVVLATKVGFADLGPGALAYDKVIAACEASVKRLGVDYIDLYLLHRADRATPIDETMRALEDLIGRGLVREIGVDNFHAWEIAATTARQSTLDRPGFAAVEVYLSLIGRQAEHEILPYCRTDGLGVLVHSPLAAGLLTGPAHTPGARGRERVGAMPPFDPDVRTKALSALQVIAERHGASMGQVALAWVLAQPGITSAIVGARSIEQLDQNLAAVELALGEDEISLLNGATDPGVLYPATVDRQWQFLEPPHDSSSPA